MNIAVICLGKLKEDYLKKALEEYLKRLSSYTKIDIIELQDEKEPPKLNSSNIQKLLEVEAAKINKHLKSDDYIISLCIEGKQKSSQELSDHISNLKLSATKRLVFIIGGSFGIHNSIKEKSKEKLSLSKMTFPHQLTRLILLEQIYRSYKIELGEPYHK